MTVRGTSHRPSEWESSFSDIPTVILDKHFTLDDDPLDADFEEQDACEELMHLLVRAEKTTAYTTAKGLQAIRMRINGFVAGRLVSS